ncbi:bifunctional YncE family protein/alkaline phosphatase family protein [Phenylobacterium montanum]|uniref:Phosphoesterase n=1 Tax=Phenylobacterium montanum TaxID=2823693 RepID=A0A975FYE8_9CAUL|nr:bifunctional YncE family protein/alkaline phosphatase family protein [Caulobacter sp. S6]QUD87580.1 hypothetical protein KCG34_21415 [Caulobacter sp. S6]
MAFAAGALARPGQVTSTGQAITPTAAAGALFEPLNPDLKALPGFLAGQASALALSPDGRTLLILTSGFNRNLGPDGKAIPELSNEYVFVYDISGAALVKRQVIALPDSFLGLVWAPGGDRFYVSGGVDDDVLDYGRGADGYALSRSIPLGHKAGLGLRVKPEVAGLAVSPDGRWLLAANLQNDSVSLVDLKSGAVSETDLRPGVIDPAHSGAPGGTFPKAVAFAANGKAYVTSQRDREIIALKVRSGRAEVARRIRTSGQPVALTVGQGGARLYAALDNTDAVAVIDTARDRLVETIPTAAPRALLPKGRPLGGAGSNSLALTPDGKTLLVTNGGQNDVAVVRLDALAAGQAAAKPKDDDGDGDEDGKPAAAAQGSVVIGLIPTGWYPTGVAVGRDARRLYVVNGKSVPGPNPLACRNTLSTAKDANDACNANNQYVWQLEKAGFLTLPTPKPAELGRLTRQAALNNHLRGAAEGSKAEATMAFLRQHIRHVIYIVKENRTYDQVLGDLEVGNGDPKLAVFGRGLTPNLHQLARQFVDLDAFYDSGESSNTGWNWSTAARTNDFTEREAPVNYAERGLQYDQEGDNRNLNVGLPTAAARKAANPVTPDDPNLLPGTADVAAPDGPGGEAGRGYIWDAALRAGLSVRNYGFYGDLSRYFLPADNPALIPLERDPRKAGLTVLYETKPALMDKTDPYFRGFDQKFPDYWRFKEWEHEFDGYVADGKLPSLTLLRLAHDHTGNFGEGLDGVDTVETEVADNDYAVGLVLQKLAQSPYAKDTLVFVVEDDAQDGPDHVDAHRSIAFVAGPYVKQGAVVSTRYDTVMLVKTMETVLGLQPMGLNDALARPMSGVFDTSKASWSYKARVPAVLRSTRLPLPPETAADAGCPAKPVRTAAWWAKAMAGQDFDEEDRLDTAAYNAALWRGLKGEAPYPAARSGRDLRQGRGALLKAGGAAACEGLARR